MTTEAQEEVTIGSYTREYFTVGEPDVSGPIAVYPVFGGSPHQEYTSVSRAQARFTVKEQPGGGSVRDVVVANPTGEAVLIYEGEEVLGGQQNRTFDKSVLIGPGQSLVTPVSCVEQGRWDGSRNAEAFSSAPQTADPELRRRKARAAHRARMAGLEERADQGEVWAQVQQRSASLGVHSATGASSEAFDSHRDTLRAAASEIRLREGQVGMIFQIGERISTLDLVSRPDVMADLHGPLVQGYCLDALGRTQPARVRGTAPAARFLRRVFGNRVFEKDGIGLGRDFRFENEHAVGAGLVCGDELIQLSVFKNRPDEAGAGWAQSATATPPVRRTRISRPSRRRT
jgi:hypothetical protein